MLFTAGTSLVASPCGFLGTLLVWLFEKRWKHLFEALQDLGGNGNGCYLREPSRGRPVLPSRAPPIHPRRAPPFPVPPLVCQGPRCDKFMQGMSINIGACVHSYPMCFSVRLEGKPTHLKVWYKLMEGHRMQESSMHN